MTPENDVPAFRPQVQQLIAGRYELLAELGRGGMGAVWRARNIALDSPCAIKFMHAELVDNTEPRRRILREARAAAQLRSPYIVTVSQHGGTCSVYPTGVVPDGLFPCRMPIPATCTGSANNYQCQANNRYLCIDGVPYGEDCGTRNALCDDQEIPGQAYCREFAKCSDVGMTCKANTLRQCTALHEEVRWDCGAVGSRCEPKGSQLAYCLPPGCTQADADWCKEHCEGDELILCSGVRLNCKDYGFTTCEQYFNQGTKEDFVFCVGRL